MGAFIGADGHGPLHLAEKSIFPGGQRLLDQLDAEIRHFRAVIAHHVGGPGFVRIDNQSGLRRIGTDSGNAFQIPLPAEFQLEQRTVPGGFCGISHFLRTIEGEGIGGNDRPRRRDAGNGSDAFAGLFRLQIPEGAVNGIARGARRHDGQQAVARQPVCNIVADG